MNALSQSVLMPGKSARRQLGCFKFGDKLGILIDAFCLQGRELAEQTGLDFRKFSKWRGNEEDRPYAFVDEVWALAKFFAPMLEQEVSDVFEYFADDEKPPVKPEIPGRQIWEEITEKPPLAKPIRSQKRKPPKRSSTENPKDKQLRSAR